MFKYPRSWINQSKCRKNVHQKKKKKTEQNKRKKKKTVKELTAAYISDFYICVEKPDVPVQNILHLRRYLPRYELYKTGEILLQNYLKSLGYKYHSRTD